MVFENRVPRRIFGSRRDEVTGEWTKLYNEVEKPEGKRPLGRPRHRWEDNTKMDLHEVGCGGLDWIKLAEDRDKWQGLVNAVMNFWVP
jgi:hypothetical protein